MNTSRLQARLRHYFISGFFALIPMGLSLVAVLWSVRLIDGTLAPLMDAALGWHFPGLGLAVATVGIVLAGMITSHVLGERLLSVTEELLLHVPVFKWVYGTLKQMVDAFSPESKSSFKSVVVVEYPRPGIFRLGFATNEISFNGRDVVSVYVPTNHVYIGDVVLIPKDEVRYTPLSIQQGIQSMLSAGATLPPKL